MRYSIDTSSLIEGFRTHYPYDVLPSLWNKRLPALTKAGDLRATEEVRIELGRQDDELLQWVDDYEDFFVPIDEPIQLEVIAILAAHPKLIHVGRGRSGADPFVIALAGLQDDCTVVCEEGNGSPTKPRMPDVCAALGVRCIRLVDMISEQGWTFG